MLLAEEIKIGELIWQFVNSPVGVSVVSGVLLWLLARLWKAKPSWEKVFDEHKGLLFDAVRHAEKAIPDDSESRAAQKTDAALQFILKLEPKVSKKKKADLRKALDLAHEMTRKKVLEDAERALRASQNGS